MAKRLFDIIFSFFALLILSPVFLIAAIGIKLGSPGPIFYMAKRAGKDALPFTMYKFRTMHVSTGITSAITGTNDSRIFRFGNFLRKTKIDELPQLINVLIGQMSIVGPRPEDIGIVQKHYTSRQLDTLRVSPGLASPGSLFNYTHGDIYLDDNDPEQSYIERLLPLKLELELYYVQNKSFWYDLEIIFRTMLTIFRILFGEEKFNYPKEYSSINNNTNTLQL